MNGRGSDVLPLVFVGNACSNQRVILETLFSRGAYALQVWLRHLSDSHMPELQVKRIWVFSANHSQDPLPIRRNLAIGGAYASLPLLGSLLNH